MNIRRLLRKMLLESMALTESQTLYIQGYNYDDSFGNLSDVLAYIQRIARGHMEEILGHQQTQQYLSGGETFTYDGGTNPFADQGILNLYLYNNMPIELGIHLSNFMQRSLLDKGVKIETREPEQSQAMGVPVIRLHVMEISDAQEEPELINLANDNAKYMFTKVLNYSDKEYHNAQFNIKDLRIRIEFAKEHMDIHQEPNNDNPLPNYYGKQYDQSDVLRRLEEFDKFAQFALEKGYQQIYIA